MGGHRRSFPARTRWPGDQVCLPQQLQPKNLLTLLFLSAADLACRPSSGSSRRVLPGTCRVALGCPNQILSPGVVPAVRWVQLLPVPRHGLARASWHMAILRAGVVLLESPVLLSKQNPRRASIESQKLCLPLWLLWYAIGDSEFCSPPAGRPSSSMSSTPGRGITRSRCQRVPVLRCCLQPKRAPMRGDLAKLFVFAFAVLPSSAPCVFQRPPGSVRTCEGREGCGECGGPKAFWATAAKAWQMLGTSKSQFVRGLPVPSAEGYHITANDCVSKNRASRGCEGRLRSSSECT